MGDIQFAELPEHNTPGTHLLFCEVYATNRIAADQQKELVIDWYKTQLDGSTKKIK